MTYFVEEQLARKIACRSSALFKYRQDKPQLQVLDIQVTSGPDGGKETLDIGPARNINNVAEIERFKNVGNVYIHSLSLSLLALSPGYIPG